MQCQQVAHVHISCQGLTRPHEAAECRGGSFLATGSGVCRASSLLCGSDCFPLGMGAGTRAGERSRSLRCLCTASCHRFVLEGVSRICEFEAVHVELFSFHLVSALVKLSSWSLKKTEQFAKLVSEFSRSYQLPHWRSCVLSSGLGCCSLSRWPALPEGSPSAGRLHSCSRLRRWVSGGTRTQCVCFLSEPVSSYPSDHCPSNKLLRTSYATTFLTFRTFWEGLRGLPSGAWSI